jgi:tetratricopeptide (TPR) repeat protein
MVKQLYRFDTLGAIAEFERAIQLNPNDATAHHWLANHSFSALGQVDREIAGMKRALELDPLSLIINTNLGQAYVYARRFDEAIAQLHKTVEMDGAFYAARYLLGQALELSGRTVEADVEYRRTVALTDDLFAKALLGHLCATTGRKDEAREILQQLHHAQELGYVHGYNFALVELGLGNRDEALNWLEQAYRNHDGFDMAPIRVDPFLEPLHGDPRFEALAEKIVPARDFTPVRAVAK